MNNFQSFFLSFNALVMYLLPICELRPNLPIGKSGIIFCFDFCATEELLCDLRHTEHRGLKIVQDWNQLYQYVVRVFSTRFLGFFLRFRISSIKIRMYYFF